MDSMKQIGFAIRDSLQVVGVDLLLSSFPVNNQLMSGSSLIEG
jgi:hypothetical protein